MNKSVNKKPISGRRDPIEFVIEGEPASKANSRRMVPRKTKEGKAFIGSIKSSKAMGYSDGFLQQCPALPEMFEEDVVVMMEIYYASRRPDLDESLILDLMQKRIYRNDRQVKARFTVWGLDPGRPRTVVRVAPMASGGIAGDIRCDVWEKLSKV